MRGKRLVPTGLRSCLRTASAPKIYAGGLKIPKMGNLTGTQHGDAANDLMAFYIEKVLSALGWTNDQILNDQNSISTANSNNSTIWNACGKSLH